MSSNEAHDSNKKERKHYEAPLVKELGHVDKLTQGEPGGGTSEGGGISVQG